MSEIIRRNFEPGKLLLVVTLLLSLTLISELYAISESFDLSNGLQLGGVELSLTASYLFTAFSMVIVINEFFKFRTKMNGLLLLNNLVSKEEQPVFPSTKTIISVPDAEVSSLEQELEADVNTDLEFEKLIEDELKETEQEDSDPNDKRTKVAVEDEEPPIEPPIEEGQLQGVFDSIEEETYMDRLLKESEVIKTLSELEDLVNELRKKKAPVIAQ
jgi:hypothetical protein